MQKKFTITKVKSGVLRGFLLLDMGWSKDERSKFLDFMENTSPADEQAERNKNGY